jgi:hydrogenase maturation protease
MTEGDGVVVIGVGNPDRGDDGVGFIVEREVRAHGSAGVRTATCQGDLTRLLDLWEGRGLAVVVDAVESGATPGSIFRWDWSGRLQDRDLPCTSTHALPLDQVLELARSLGRLPPRLVVYGVEVGEVRNGRELSPPVADAVPLVVARVLSDVVGIRTIHDPDGQEGRTHA